MAVLAYSTTNWYDAPGVTYQGQVDAGPASPVALFDAWMKSEDGQRCLLAEVEYVHWDNGVSNLKTMYCSNLGYSTSRTAYNSPSDNTSRADLFYAPILVEGFDVSAELPVSMEDVFNVQSSWGTLKLNNSDGTLDHWLVPTATSHYIFKNRRIRLFLGSPDWERQDFQFIGSLLIDDITADAKFITIRFKDTLQLWNQPVNVSTTNTVVRKAATYSSNIVSVTNTSVSTITSSSIVPGSGRNINDLYIEWNGVDMPSTHEQYQNRNTMLPVAIGQCFNITPLDVSKVITGVKDYAYMVNDGAINSIVAVRDNGVLLHPTQWNLIVHSGSGTNYGMFNLKQPPVGQITCDVRGKVFSSGISLTSITSTSTPSSMYCDDAANLALNIFSHCGIIPKLDGVTSFTPNNIGIFTSIRSFYQFHISNCTTVGGTKRGTVGYYGTSSDNILQIVQQFVGSCLGAIFINRDRLLDIKPIVVPPLSYNIDSAELGVEDIIRNSFKVVQVSAPSSSSVKLEYNKNHSPTDSLAGSVWGDPGYADRLSKPARTIELVHSELANKLSSWGVVGWNTTPNSIINQYDLPVTNSKTFSSLISNVGNYSGFTTSGTPAVTVATYSTVTGESDASSFAELLAAYRLNYMCRRNVLIEVSMTSTHWNLDLGEVVKLAYYRYGMKDIPAIVVSRSDNVVKNIYKVKLLI